MCHLQQASRYFFREQNLQFYKVKKCKCTEERFSTKQDKLFSTSWPAGVQTQLLAATGLNFENKCIMEISNYLYLERNQREFRRIQNQITV